MPDHLLTILVKLFIAHLLGDFLFQPGTWVNGRNKGKIKSRHLYYHILVHGILAYVFIGNWLSPWLPAIIMVVHLFIDLFKIYKLKALNGFIIDQMAHIIATILIWAIYFHHELDIFTYINNLHISFNTWCIISGYIIVTWPTAIFIKNVTEMLDIGEEETANSKVNNGKWIGIIERVLILSFILAGYAQAIGFLIAAKSVFRVKDIRNEKDQRKSEYILVGTLLSFAMSSLVGIVLTQMLN